jgi:hypothetical protein
LRRHGGRAWGAASFTGTVNVTYDNNTDKLAVKGGTLHIWNVAGCFGLINSGDAASYAATLSQTITSP